MQVYLVGGAVRDQLLNYPYHEHDWVVVGATPEQMLAQGYQQVGKDFPVFLHPKTKEEYALARTERKQGSGYTGFSVHAAPDVTLEQDLQRRDLTINAIAQDSAGNLVDPYGGATDIKHKILRHVSAAFSEDPLRVLRVARFYARYHHLGFRVADETLALMQQIVQQHELLTLSAERIWQETLKALKEQTPQAYFRLLMQCGALQQLMPELAALWGVPQPERWHPEIDTGEHCMLVLEQAARLTANPEVRFAALVHDLGKGVTDPALWPAHHGHDSTGLPLIRQLCQRLRIPNDFRDLALLVCQYHQQIHTATTLRPVTLLRFFDGIDLWRKSRRLDDILLACKADLCGRTGFEQEDYPQAEYIHAMAKAALAVDVRALVAQGLKGEEIKLALDKARLAAITAARDHYPHPA